MFLDQESLRSDPCLRFRLALLDKVTRWIDVVKADSASKAYTTIFVASRRRTLMLFPVSICLAAGRSDLGAR